MVFLSPGFVLPSPPTGSSSNTVQKYTLCDFFQLTLKKLAANGTTNAVIN